jgi:hypothetical protein
MKVLILATLLFGLLSPSIVAACQSGSMPMMIVSSGPELSEDSFRCKIEPGSKVTFGTSEIGCSLNAIETNPHVKKVKLPDLKRVTYNCGSDRLTFSGELSWLDGGKGGTFEGSTNFSVTNPVTLKALWYISVSCVEINLGRKIETCKEIEPRLDL